MNANIAAVQKLLLTRFPDTRCDALLRHYNEMIDELQRSHWQMSTVKSGQFVEAVLKCLWEHCGKVVPADKDFKVDKIINQLPQEAPLAKDTIKLTVPRACRFIYDVASNRGARHDSGEIDPNVMDANAVAAMCSWILAELVRYSQEGKLSAPAAENLVAKLTEKKYPLFEEVDGRLYFADPSLSARKLALLLLAYSYPARMSREELIRSVSRHGHTTVNARKAIERLKTVCDDDGSGRLRLRAPGLKEAELFLSTVAL